MSREIKFRGKSKRTGQWIYGDLLTSPNGLLKYIVQKSKFNRAFLKNLAPEEVEYGSDGEYTGRKDCKGKEIYEGDIVHLSSGSIGQISYNTHNTGFTLTPNKTNQRSEVVLDNLHTGMEVIGNIYENLELLEDKNV